MTDTNKTIDADDPRLTAYALGELPQEERAEVEALLAADPTLREQVARVQRVATLLEEDLKADAAEEPVAPLSTEQRARVERAGTRTNAPSGRTKPPAKQGLLVTLRPVVLAASVLAAGGLSLSLFMTARRSAPEAGPMAAAADPFVDQAFRQREAEARAVKLRELAEMERAQNEALRRPRPTSTEAPPATEPPPRPTHDPMAPPIGLDTAAFSAPAEAPPPPSRPSGPPPAPPTSRGFTAGGEDGALAFGAGVGGADGGRVAGARGKAPRLGRERDQAPVGGNFSYEPDVEELARPTAGPAHENAFKPVAGEDVESTFSIDVDTASYANVRRFLSHHQLPPADVVRLEEMINYFRYDYAQPTGSDPFAAHVEVTGCPWQPAHRLVRIGLKGRELDMAKRPAANLVFLIDVSGSMNEPQKLPLVKEALRALVAQTTERDRVAIVVYAGAAGLVLPSTTGDRHDVILRALDQLQAGGSTNGGAGIELAYRTAIEHFKEGGINRVVLCSDGDWNVGLRGDALQRLIEQKARSNVFLTVLGFGGSNFNDKLSETLADKGNGNYAVIDSAREAKKVLVEQAAGTLVTIAKDVKVQVAWNPKAVKRYRLLGYENRVMANQDFRDDKKDAGEIGAGHTVTALYEVEPTGAADDSVLTLRLRYKQPEGDTARELTHEVRDAGRSFDAASEDTRWAASAAAFGMLLRGSEHRGQATWALVRELAQGAVGKDVEGHRAEMVRLIDRARELSR